MATVLLNSEPDSIILKHNGMISVVNKNVITSCSSVCGEKEIGGRFDEYTESNAERGGERERTRDSP